MIEYKLARSKRKTIAIHVQSERVEVRAPLRMPKREIEKFVMSKEKWILKQLAEFRVQKAQQDAFVLDYGSKLLYRGTEYPLEAGTGRRSGFDGSAFYVPPNLSSEQIREACIKTYRALTRRDLSEKLRAYAGQMGVMPARLRISSAISRWGSCSAQKNLNFSWRLIMAEDAVIDYVVVHELAHLKELNHSERFWAVVESVFPDYRERRAKLRELQKRILIEGWDH